MEDNIQRTCRREAYERVTPAHLRARIVELLDKSTVPLNAVHVAEKLGVPITSVRPRMTELSDRDYCIEHFRTGEAVIYAAGYVYHHSTGTRRLTGYLLYR